MSNPAIIDKIVREIRIETCDEDKIFRDLRIFVGSRKRSL